MDDFQVLHLTWNWINHFAAEIFNRKFHLPKNDLFHQIFVWSIELHNMPFNLRQRLSATFSVEIFFLSGNSLQIVYFKIEPHSDSITNEYSSGLIERTCSIWNYLLHACDGICHWYSQLFAHRYCGKRLSNISALNTKMPIAYINLTHANFPHFYLVQMLIDMARQRIESQTWRENGKIVYFLN